MLRVKTSVATSQIHGLGCFSEEFIKQGTVVWTLDKGIDVEISASVVDTLPELIKEHFVQYGSLENGVYLLCPDDARFMNHSDNANLVLYEVDNLVAARDIQRKEELTCNYFTFDDIARYNQELLWKVKR